MTTHDLTDQAEARRHAIAEALAHARTAVTFPITDELRARGWAELECRADYTVDAGTPPTVRLLLSAEHLASVVRTYAPELLTTEQLLEALAERITGAELERYLAQRAMDREAEQLRRRMDDELGWGYTHHYAECGHTPSFPDASKVPELCPVCANKASADAEPSTIRRVALHGDTSTSEPDLATLARAVAGLQQDIADLDERVTALGDEPAGSYLEDKLHELGHRVDRLEPDTLGKRLRNAIPTLPTAGDKLRPMEHLFMGVRADQWRDSATPGALLPTTPVLGQLTGSDVCNGIAAMLERQNDEPDHRALVGQLEQLVAGWVDADDAGTRPEGAAMLAALRQLVEL